jgi:hypothetical protein
MEITIRSQIQIKIQPRRLIRLQRHRPRPRELPLHRVVCSGEESFEEDPEDVERTEEDRVGFGRGGCGEDGGRPGVVGCDRVGAAAVRASGAHGGGTVDGYNWLDGISVFCSLYGIG